jgi:dTDP-4-amino-4,6-dideoxygalactose transaminase
VITTLCKFISTEEVIIILVSKLVFLNINYGTYNIYNSKIEMLITLKKLKPL